MVDEDIGCCASIQKWLIVIVNIILFIAGTIQIGFTCYVLVAGSDSLGFAADVLDGNETFIHAMLAFGIVIVVISLVACVGAKMESKCMLWVYAVILFFMIMGQAMVVCVTAVSMEYGDSIFQSLWRRLDADTIEDIEQTYKCCSFNGENLDTSWPADAAEYTVCSSENDWNPMETCWGKFKSNVDENYGMIKMITIIILAMQVVIYFSTHFVIQAIAEAEGIEREKGIEISGAPYV